MKNFLGRGIQFPICLDARGNLALSEYEQNIEESIAIILGSAPGERMMRPEFGCKIHDFVFHPNNAGTSSEVSYHARESLVKWEPRIEDIKVSAYPDGSRENVMLIDVTYRVIRTNRVRNMVYPFFLRREQDL